MNTNLTNLHAYLFQKISTLIKDVTPNEQLVNISLAIGEPKHECPSFIIDSLVDHLSGISQYPLTKGHLELRQSIANWLVKRFNLPEASINAERNILPVNGTREGLFSFAQAVVDRSMAHASVVMPNPFYQIYEGAAILAGARPIYLDCREENNFLPDLESLDKKVWKQCQLFYMCSPSNPTGAVADKAYLTQLLNLAETYDFIVASDECYSELYFDENNPPIGLLDVANQMGNTDYKRCVVFHSLSKRSNVPGLRSGFVAGDADLLKIFLLYRTYHGSAMPLPTQMASIAAWKDEEHVKKNRALYREKFDAVLAILSPVMDVQKPNGGFYLWPKLTMNDELFTQNILQEKNVSVVPGSYLSRKVNDYNPGENHIRMALVATHKEVIEASYRIRDYFESTTHL